MVKHKESIMNTLLNGLTNGLDLYSLRKPSNDDDYVPASPTSQNPVEILESELGRRLGFTPVGQANAADFTPAAVADRILGFVETAITQRAGSTVEAQSMLEQAKEGIEKGFKEAREILENMPQMNDEINALIDETESLVSKGLESLENITIDTPRQQQIGQLISESASLSSQFTQSSEASIQIVTQDGDQIDVSFSAFVQASASQSVAIDQQGVPATFDASFESSASFQFSVQGNLDEGERKAVNELLEDVGELANKFFNGDVQAAFNASLELGFDSEELKSFAVDFQQTTTFEVAQAYQRTEQLSDPLATSSAPAASIPSSSIPVSPVATGPVLASPAPAIDVLSQLDQLIKQEKESDDIKEPEKTIKSLLADMLDLLNEGYDSPVQSYIKDIIESV
jgi:hypothetical protein